MAASSSLLALQFILLALVVADSTQLGVTDDDKQVYIVYMGSLPAENEYSPQSHHVSILQEVVKGRSARDSLVRSYKRSFNGFAAKLSSEEAAKISGMHGVVSVFPSKTLHLHTTRSWDFMGFPATAKRNPTIESDVIIGVLDNGIWLEIPSFNDEGFGPPPKKWKGECAGGDDFTCNRKVVGARFYDGSELLGARDQDGHGCHTASTAAGGIVSGASFFGIAEGTARGGVPSARIAAYRVCAGREGCQGDQVLAAFDDAIHDGVDIITISIGPNKNDIPWEQDPISIGSFHAMERGILTVNSAGNNGPSRATMSSTAPWLLSVAASNTDRRIIDKIILGNGHTFTAKGINPFTMKGNKYPLSYGDEYPKESCKGLGRLCRADCLDKKKVKGKIVLCDSDIFNPFFEAFEAGAAGAITVLVEKRGSSTIEPLPAATLDNLHDYASLHSYFNSSKNSEATILSSETIKDSNAPLIASFSSKGPNSIAPDILKPDITAPGVDILAGFSPDALVSGHIYDKRRANFSILSGTSMSCPHVTGAAAYVKTFHPDWSPSTLKSALMTTAWPMNETQHKSQEFSYGAGHLNPVKATDPGLVYEISKDEYLAMLCSQDITYFGKCPTHVKVDSPKDLNLPSMAFQVNSGEDFEIKFPRTVTNVGLSNATYNATISTSSTSVYKIKVSVEPSTLSFKSLDEKKSFVVNVDGNIPDENAMFSASLVWSDGTHHVRSPIVVFTNLGPNPDE